MQNQLEQTEHKLQLIIRHAPIGIAEIDSSGTIIHLNQKGKDLLKPVFIAYNMDADNLFRVLEHIAPDIKDKIERSEEYTGHIITNQSHCFRLSFGSDNVERHFSFTVIRIASNSIIISFDDHTQRHLNARAIQQIISEKALIQGKFEIASNVLHDIGNAVVGFGTYITRIKRSLEENNPANLQKLSDFLVTQQAAIANAITEAKASAVVGMLNGITKVQRNTHEEISKSVIEQLHIITHIQDILNIHRQYVNGNEALEKKPTNLRSIINDCMSMLFASIEKRKINVSVSIPEHLPVINADRTRLMQVILNVMKNSIEAIDINGLEKNIKLCVHIQGSLLVMQVKDSGHGFDTDTGGQLFERGFTTKASGSGLGLANCRAIIEGHNGTIELLSEGFGKGAVTTIKFTI
jgi:signal transduction histidine kinase